MVQFSCLDKTIIIPGHGPVGNKDQLIECRDMMVTVRDTIAALKKKGYSYKQVLAEKPTAAYDDKWGKWVIPQKTQTLVRKFKSLFPEIKLDVAYAWAGTFGETKDGLAYIGKIRNLPHAYFALGYGGNGITYSVLASEIIRDDFLGRKNRDAAIFSFNR